MVSKNTIGTLEYHVNTIVQVHLKKSEYREKVVFCNLFQKVKLSYILDSLHEK